MTRTFLPAMGILPPPQRALWPSLRPTTALGFVLYGGTAVALRLGHRSSVDFDFFSSEPLRKDYVREVLPIVKMGEVIQDAPETLTVLCRSGENMGTFVKLSFFGGLRIGRAGVPERTEDGVVDVASPEDLLATKLKAVMSRVESKDYRDIASLLSAGVRLEIGLSIAAAMHPQAFQPQECLRALTFFEGGDLAKLARSERAVLVERSRGVREIPPSPPLTLRLAA